MTLSYPIVCMLLNFLVDFLAIMLLVQSTARSKNPYNIAIGSAVYLAIVIFFSTTTTGWSALFAGIVGSCGIFWLGEPREVCRMWGRVVGKVADLPRVRRFERLHDALLTASDAMRLLY